MEFMKNLSCIILQIILITNLIACNSVLSKTHNITETKLLTIINSNTLKFTPTVTKTRKLTATRTSTHTTTSKKMYIPSDNDLNQTVWDATLHYGITELSCIFAFYEDGRLYIMDRGQIAKNNTWTIKGNLLILNIENGKRIYRGKFLNKDNIVGIGKSEDGETLTWEAHRENLGWNFGE
jgi:hypothetical protein